MDAMPYVDVDGTKLYYEEAGVGHPIVFVHEFAGDLRSWEPQMRYFSRRYRCIAYCARGYPPSDVPEDPAQYSQDIATDDLAGVVRGLGIDKAHIVGLSMGGFAALHFGLRYGAMASALVVAGCGYGAPREERDRFREETEALADRFEQAGTAAAADAYCGGPCRVQYQAKDARGWAEFRAQFIEHSAKGSANTLRGVQARRPSLYDLEAELKALIVPTLLVTGDEDEPCLDATVWLKRTIPSAGLVILPRTGHTANLEEPEAFNRACEAFFSSVERGRWSLRDPRSLTGAIMMSGASEGAG